MIAVLALVVAAVTDAGAQDGQGRRDARYALASGAERISLIAVPASALTASSLTIEPLDGRIELKVGKNAARAAAAIRPALAGFCRKLDARRGSLVFTCETKRIDARLFVDDGRPTLEVYELRGLPYRGEAQMLPVVYPPHVMGLGAPCPGDTPASRGECAIAAGSLAEAEVQLRLATDSPHQSYAAVRLGDLSLMRGDAVGAFAWYRKANAVTVWGRVAAARMCLLGGTCLGDRKTHVWSPSGMLEPLRTELALHRARASAFADRPAELLAALKEAIETPLAAPLCIEGGVVFCRRLIVHAIERAKRDDVSAAIDLYLRLPARTTGPWALRLGVAAADRAAEIGAPVFAANVMAALTPLVAEEDHLSHLLRTAELYLKGDDRARSGAIVEYVDSRYSRKQTAGARWAAVRKEVSRMQEDGAIRPDAMTSLDVMSTEAARDVAAAWSAVSRARMETR